MHPKLEYEIKQAVSSLEMMTERYMPSWEGGGACAALNVIKQLQELLDKTQNVCASAYILAGIVDAPLRFLDALDDAANGEPGLRANIEELIPVRLEECNEFKKLQKLAHKNASLELDAKNAWERYENANSSRMTTESQLGFANECIVDLRKEIERLEACLQWEQNRAGRIGTHWHDCHLSGSTHYECLLRKYEEVKGKLTSDEILAIAKEAGAVSYSPPPMRAVRGVSFTFEQLEYFVELLSSHQSKTLASVQPAQSVDAKGWISVNDVLPPEVEFGVTDDVLVYFDGLECPFDIANYDHEAKHWSLPNQGYSQSDCEPTHWMPLPPLSSAPSESKEPK